MTRTQYKNKYIKENYDRINLCIPKGEKCKIKAVASEFDISVNEYLFLLLTSDCKNGYINDITGTNRIYTDKTREIRRIIVKSHIKLNTAAVRI